MSKITLYGTWSDPDMKGIKVSNYLSTELHLTPIKVISDNEDIPYEALFLNFN